MVAPVRARALAPVSSFSFNASAYSSTTLLYNTRCSGVRETMRVFSTLSGRSSMMVLSLLRRLRIKGVTTFLRFSILSSAVESMKEAKSFSSPRRPGERKSNMDQRFKSEFSIGVPVMAMACFLSRAFMTLVCFVFLFFMFWASSRITRSHFSSWMAALVAAPWYVTMVRKGKSFFFASFPCLTEKSKEGVNFRHSLPQFPRREAGTTRSTFASLFCSLNSSR